VICPVLFPFVLVAVLSSFPNDSALVYASFLSLHILTSFRFHHSRALRPAAMLSKCPQALSDKLRLNKIITAEFNLCWEGICDEQLKAPPQLGEGDRV